MRIIIDEREPALYERCSILAKSIPTIEISKKVLPLGDIILKSSNPSNDDIILLIERKTFSDLLASIKDGRYEEQSYRLLYSTGLPPHSIIYLLEGMFSQLRNDVDKKIIYSAMTSLQYFKGFSIQRTSMINESAEWIINMAKKIERKLADGSKPYYLSSPYLKSVLKFSNINNYNNINKILKSVESESTESIETALTNDIINTEIQSEDINQPVLNNTMEPSENSKNNIEIIIENKPETETQPDTTSEIPEYCTVVKKVKKENVTPENIGEIILCQIPGISSVTAITIMKHFGTFPNMIQKIQIEPKCLDNIHIENNGKKRKINKNCIENIKRFLIQNTLVNNST
jgi:ERCC4-type nuclease